MYFQQKHELNLIFDQFSILILSSGKNCLSLRDRDVYWLEKSHKRKMFLKEGIRQVSFKKVDRKSKIIYMKAYFLQARYRTLWATSESQKFLEDTHLCFDWWIASEWAVQHMTDYTINKVEVVEHHKEMC